MGLIKPLLPEGSTVQSLMPPGRSEHGFEFTPSDLSALAKADIVVLVGLGLEPRVEKELEAHPVEGRQIVNLGTELGLHQKDDVHDHGHDHDAKDGPAHGEAGHVHTDTCDHGEGWVDQHVWLDPVLVQGLIPTMKDAVAAALKHRGAPAGAIETLDAASQSWTEKVVEVHTKYTEQLEPLKGRVLATHHNAFSRIAERYGLTIAASIRELEDSEPTPAEIARAVKAIRDGKVRAVFVEPQMNQAVPRRIAEMAKVKVGLLDPLGDGDWLALMEKNLESLVANLGDGSKPTPGDSTGDSKKSVAPAPTPPAQPAKDSPK